MTFKSTQITPRGKAVGASALAAAFALVAGLAACTSGPSQQAASATQEVALQFAAEVNGTPFACGQSYSGVGTTRSTVTPSDFRFYVSEVQLINAAGQAVPVQLTQDGVWQLENLALLDFENATGPCRNGTSGVNTAVRGRVPVGDYVGLQFTLGVPFNRNHGDPTVAPAPLSTTAMFWNWQGGYKFLKFDAATSGMQAAAVAPGTGHGHGHGGAAASGFSVHLGSTVCAAASRTEAPSACQNPNRVSVQFGAFNPARQTVVADIGRILSGANVDVNAPNTSPGCMSFPRDADCPPVMGALGLAYEGVAAPGPQRLFALR